MQLCTLIGYAMKFVLFPLVRPPDSFFNSRGGYMYYQVYCKASHHTCLLKVELSQIISTALASMQQIGRLYSTLFLYNHAIKVQVKADQ